jgi:hypothetical protein
MNSTRFLKILPFRAINTRNAVATAAVILIAQAGHAATASFSSTAPTLGPTDLGNLTGANVDANNVSSGGDNATYLAHNRPIQGQTFTTGNNPAGYQLTAVTLRQVT